MFFKKNDLSYFGVYHTHPQGIAYPSDADIKTGQKFHFIISLQNKEQPDFKAFQIVDREPYEIPIFITSDDRYAVKDLLTGQIKNQATDINEIATSTSEKIHNIINDKPNHYPKIKPDNPYSASDFSTFA